LSVCNLRVHFLNLLSDSLYLRDQSLSCLNLLVLDLILDVGFVIFKEVNFRFKRGTALLDRFNISVNIREGVFKLL